MAGSKVLFCLKKESLGEYITRAAVDRGLGVIVTVVTVVLLYFRSASSSVPFNSLVGTQHSSPGMSHDMYT